VHAAVATTTGSAQYARTSWTIDDETGARPVAFGIVFDAYSSWDTVEYTLRGTASSYPPTDTDLSVDVALKEVDQLWWNYAQTYLTEGFMDLQMVVDQLILENLAADAADVRRLKFGYFAFPTEAYSDGVQPTRGAGVGAPCPLRVGHAAGHGVRLRRRPRGDLAVPGAVPSEA